MTKTISQSKTKIGAVVGGIAIIGGAIAAAYDGAISGIELVSTIGLGIGAVLFGLGLRDALEKK